MSVVFTTALYVVGITLGGNEHSNGRDVVKELATLIPYLLPCLLAGTCRDDGDVDPYDAGEK